MITARFVKDIERCPYLPTDVEYKVWMENDQKRLRALEDFYQSVKTTAHLYCSHEDKNIRNMCHFVLNMIKD